MNIDKGKLSQLMDEVSAEKGEFTLFGLFERDEAPDKWELVVSSPWLEEGKLKALGEFVQKLKSAIGRKQMLSLSRVVTLNADEPALEAVLKAVEVEHGMEELHDSELSGLKFKHAYIFRAKRPQHSELSAT